MKIGDYILKEDIRGKEHLEQIRQAVKVMGYQVDSACGRWPATKNHDINLKRLMLDRDGDLIWVPYCPMGNRIHPADLLSEPAWIEHDGSEECPMAHGNSVEIIGDLGQRSIRSYEGDSRWPHIRYWRDWTAFHENQQQPKDRPQWGEVVHVNRREVVVTGKNEYGRFLLRDQEDHLWTAPLLGIDEYKPCTIRIGEREVPEPVREPLEEGEEYWFVDFSENGVCGKSIWDGRGTDGDIDHFRLKRGLIHRTQHAARQHAEALIAVFGGEV